MANRIIEGCCKELIWVSEKSGKSFFCHIGDYDLTIRRISDRRFEWVVLFMGIQISDPKQNECNQKNKAIGIAEGFYLGHKMSTQN